MSTSTGTSGRNDGEMRVEHDTMGEVLVPAWAKWGAQTQRAVENFTVSGRPLDHRLVRALGLVKAAAATVNTSLGVLTAETGEAIAAAAASVAEGDWDGHFPVDVFQTGSGTSSNMNANEVIATLASERVGHRVHPNDDVNASQSSNDVFPTAIHLATVLALTNELVPALDTLAQSLARRAEDTQSVVKAGRTHLMDATPVTLGQELDGYAHMVRNGIERIQAALPRVSELPLGGTAVGSGLNAPTGFAAGVAEELSYRTELSLMEARNHFEAQGSRDALVEVSGALRTVAVGLFKISNDLRLMSSGPRAGLAEIHLPELQPGSSIMPGKVNPVVPELVRMVAAQVVGNDAATAFSGAVGELELNVMMPVMARNVLESIALLAGAAESLATRCVDGMSANTAHAATLAAGSPAIVTPLNRYIGYEAAAAVAKDALRRGVSIRQAVIDAGHVDDGSISLGQLDGALDLLTMAQGGR
jgi:fumarate hydratase class II